MPTHPPSEVELAMLAEARNEVGAADHKASMVLAVLGIGFGALLGGLIAQDWSPRELDLAGATLWWVGAALAALALVSSACAVWPRFTLPASTSEVFFWGHVATFATQERLEKALDRHPPRLEDRTRHQLFALSTIVARKYLFVRRAMVLAGASAPFFLLASLVGY